MGRDGRLSRKLEKVREQVERCGYIRAIACVQSGGTVNFTGTPFQANSTSLAGDSAAILTN
jgi:hypothetical protein